MSLNYLELPPEVVEALHLEEKEEVEVVLDHQGLLFKSRSPIAHSRLSNWGLLACSILLTLLVYGLSFVQSGAQVNLVGKISIMSYLVMIGFPVGMLIFVIGLIRNRDYFSDNLTKGVFLRILPVLTVALTLIVGLLLLGVAWLLHQVFLGASFDHLTASMIFLTLSFALNNLLLQLSKEIKASWLGQLFTVVIISGVLLAMATNSNKKWWQVNLSFLGTENANDAWGFNLTLILSAFIFFAFVDYLFVALKQRFPKSKRLLILRVLLSLLAVDLGLVGYFPNNASSHVIHTRFAGYLVYLIIALIISVPWLMPKADKDFTLSSYAVGLVLILVEIAYQGIGYLSLTSFEIIAFLLAFTWVFRLLNRLQELIFTNRKVFTLKLTSERTND